MLTPTQCLPPKELPLATASVAAQYNYSKTLFCDFGFFVLIAVVCKETHIQNNDCFV